MPRPVAPMVISLARASSMVLAPAVCHSAIVSMVGLIEPIQWNWPVSNLMFAVPSTWAIGMPFWIMPM